MRKGNEKILEGEKETQNKKWKEKRSIGKNIEIEKKAKELKQKKQKVEKVRLAKVGKEIWKNDFQELLGENWKEELK